ncbi:CEF1 [Candida metapsilosis]|uniref:Pre-mRNA-splicing factor CEF1 n=1 Tax=Candida metapsilosis TaxID=273372 RepID=A0A8H8D8W8_9ASCO|nr:CEF1 [Candida metapsilosis]
MSSYVKGGAWTSIEDEILKAAVQKYGTNQWARVSSLLPRKTAAQAKSRWVEWLNPLINKTGWTSEQDKRLIELTRLLPNQWRSIASTLGRTATQCVERYQQLLDEASGNEGSNDLKLSGPGIETLPAVGQPTAQIIDNDESNDPNFAHETQPAKSPAGSDDEDDEDMEDDDREMLAEAKARLSNTQGKKAKRKARERMLEESKRLALLQKRRDMKAAGLNVNLQPRNKKSKKEFDYNADIPHEIVPPAGPYDVSEENRENALELEQFQNQVSRMGISLKEVDDKIEAMKEKSQMEKKRQRDNDADKESEETSRSKGIEFKKQKSDQPTGVPQQVQPEPEAHPEAPKKANKVLALLVKSLFDKLPEPKHHQGQATLSEPKNTPSSKEEPISAPHTIDDTQRLRMSQCIRRGLSIPDPLLLDNSVELSKVKEVQNEITKEFIKLVASDYRRERDPSFYTQLTIKLDEKIYESVEKQLDKECRKRRQVNHQQNESGSIETAHNGVGKSNEKSANQKAESRLSELASAFEAELNEYKSIGEEIHERLEEVQQKLESR